MSWEKCNDEHGVVIDLLEGPWSWRASGPSAPRNRGTMFSSRGCKGLQPSRSIMAHKVLIGTWRALVPRRRVGGWGLCLAGIRQMPNVGIAIGFHGCERTAAFQLRNIYRSLDHRIWTLSVRSSPLAVYRFGSGSGVRSLGFGDNRHYPNATSMRLAVLSCIDDAPVCPCPQMIPVHRCAHAESDSAAPKRRKRHGCKSVASRRP
jgi:hypothetical protein